MEKQKVLIWKKYENDAKCKSIQEALFFLLGTGINEHGLINFAFKL